MHSSQCTVALLNQVGMLTSILCVEDESIEHTAEHTICAAVHELLGLRALEAAGDKGGAPECAPAFRASLREVPIESEVLAQ